MFKKILSLICAASMLIIGIPVYSTGEDFEITISSPNTANIFYDEDVCELTISIKNNSATTKNAEVEYKIYHRNYVDGIESLEIKEAQTKSVTFAANETINETLFYKPDKYGIYECDVRITEGSTQKAAENIVFAKSAKSAVQNKTFGASVHLTRSQGDAETAFELMQNAGFGLARDDFEWKHYEREPGVYALRNDSVNKQKDVLEAAKKYNIDMLAILSGSNTIYDYDGSNIPGEAYLDEFGSYITHFMSEPLVKETVKMVEVINEPVGVERVTGVTLGNKPSDENSLTSDSFYQPLGAAYAKALKTAYNAVKSVNENMPVGGFSAHKTGYEAQLFIDGVLAEFSKENPIKQYWDAFTIHPYNESPKSGGNAAEDDGDPEPGDYGTQKDNIWKYGSTEVMYEMDKIISGLEPGWGSGTTYTGFENTEHWSTEVGFATDDKGDKAYYNQMINLIRQKVLLDGYGASRNEDTLTDKMWIYGLIDKNINDTREDSFGILECYDESVEENPLAPKPAYIGIANFNSLVADATRCEQLRGRNTEDTDGQYRYIYKYTCPDREVYMLWHSEGENDSWKGINYGSKLGEGKTLTYYDIWGNELNESFCYKDIGNGVMGYAVSKTPYYIVAGEPVSRNGGKATGLEGTRMVNISGNIASEQAGKNISLTVGAPGSAFDANLKNNLLYADQMETGEDGAFNFDFNVPEQGKAFNAYIMSEDAESVLTFNLKGAEADIDLSVASGMLKLKEGEVNLSDMSKATAVIDFGQNSKEYNYILYLAAYKDDILVEVKKEAGVRAEDGNNKLMFKLPLTASGVDRVTLMLWSGGSVLEPLCEAVFVN